MSVKAPSIVFDAQMLTRVQELCALGARPPVIQALMPNFPEKFIKHLWEQEHGHRPPRGPLPHNVKHFLQNADRKLQASYFISCFQRMRNAGVSDMDALISAFRRYVEVFSAKSGEVSLSFDRAWVFMREFVSVKSIELLQCENCGTSYLHYTDELPNHRLCPVRRLVADYPALIEARERRIERHAQKARSEINTPATRDRSRAYRPAETPFWTAMSPTITW